MKQIVFIFTLIFSFQGFTQESKNEKIYEFDYFLEYETNVDCNKPPCKWFYLINSIDNSYTLKLIQDRKNKKYLNILFREFYKVYASGNMTREDFYEEDTLDFKCGYKKIDVNNELKNNSLNKYKDTKYVKSKDTIIDGLIHYKLIRENSLRSKKNIKPLKDNFIVVLPLNEFNSISSSDFLNKMVVDNSELEFGGIVKYVFSNHLSSSKKYFFFKTTLIDFTKFKKVVKISLDCNK